MDCILSELKEVEDHSLVLYVAETIHKPEIRSLYESFCKKEEEFFDKEDGDLDENDTYLTECDDQDDPFLHRLTIGGQNLR